MRASTSSESRSFFGLLATLGDERRDVLRDRGGVAEDVAARRHADRPVEELLPVFAREAERDADRLHRHVGRHLFVEVGLAEGLDAQQVLVDDGLDDVALPTLHLRAWRTRSGATAASGGARARPSRSRSCRSRCSAPARRTPPTTARSAWRSASSAGSYACTVIVRSSTTPSKLAAQRVREVLAQAPVLDRALLEELVEHGIRIVDDARRPSRGSAPRRPRSRRRMISASLRSPSRQSTTGPGWLPCP